MESNTCEVLASSGRHRTPSEYRTFVIKTSLGQVLCRAPIEFDTIGRPKTPSKYGIIERIITWEGSRERELLDKLKVKRDPSDYSHPMPKVNEEEVPSYAKVYVVRRTVDEEERRKLAKVLRLEANINEAIGFF